jgi:hypothetical protein
MKTRFVVILCLVNAAVLAAGYYFFSGYWGYRAQADHQIAQAEVESWKAKAEAIAAKPPMVVVQTNAFRWSQLESTDYRQYIANLRAVGCPEVTLRDIIMTDVMRLYAQRRGQFSQNGRDFKYWETDEKRKLKQTQIEEREKQLAQIVIGVRPGICTICV